MQLSILHVFVSSLSSVSLVSLFFFFAHLYWFLCSSVSLVFLFSLVCVPLFFILCLHISLLICRLLQIWQLWAMLVLTPLCALQCLAPRPVPLLKALSTLPVMVSVKTLKTSLVLVYALVKNHCMYGHAGVATVLFNNFLGLWASSMIRQVNKRFDDLLAGARRIIRLLPPLGLFRGWR